MDSPSKTTVTSDFRTPPRILIPKLACSRDKWKAKATARKRQYRKEKVRSRDLECSRQLWKDRWKDRALAAEQKLLEVQQEVQRSGADLAQARSDIAQLQDDAKKN
jgi:hypothetical protein